MAQYASRLDLCDAGLPSAALESVDADRQDGFLNRAGDLIDTYLRSKHSLPITGTLNEPTGPNTFPGELVRCNVIIAAYDLLQWRGYNPDEFDEGWRQRYEDCIEWLRMLARGEVSLDGAVDQTPNVIEGGARVHGEGSPKVYAAVESNAKRGW